MHRKRLATNPTSPGSNEGPEDVRAVTEVPHGIRGRPGGARPARIPFPMLVVAWMALGCTSMEERWEAATKADDVSAYRRFLSRYPDSEFSADARERIRSLSFEKARQADTVAELERFLEDFPEGPEADRARARVAYLNLRAAVSTRSYGVIEDFAAKQQDPVAAEQARALLKKFRRYTVTAGGGHVWKAPSTARGSRAVVAGQCALGASSSVGDALQGLFEGASALPLSALDHGSGTTGGHADCPPWVLVPATTSDFLLIESGAYAIVEAFERIGLRFGGADGRQAAQELTAKPFSPTVPVFTFSSTLEDDNLTAAMGDFRLRIAGTSRLSLEVKTIAIHWKNRGLYVSTTSVDIDHVTFHGTVRLPADRWVRLRPGLDVRGGAMELGAEGIRLVEGTEVAALRKTDGSDEPGGTQSAPP